MKELRQKFESIKKVAQSGLGVFYNSCAVGIGDGTDFFVDYMNCDEKSFFDIASLTKPIAGSLICIKLGILDDKIADFLPEPSSDQRKKKKITVSDILKHKAGFKSHYPLFKKFENMKPSEYTRELLMQEAWNLPLENEEGKIIYSDIGFICLTYYIEKKFGEKINRIFRENFGFPEIHFFADLPENSKVIPTSYEKRVHDENSYYMMSLSLHAGLFCTPNGLSKAIKYIIDNFSDLFLKEGIKEIEKGERFFLGFDSFVCRGKILFGHLGFTGCGFWIDFQKKTYSIFLSNRVFPSTGKFPTPAPEGFMNIRKRVWQILCEE